MPERAGRPGTVGPVAQGNEMRPAPLTQATTALAACALRASALLLRGRLRQPRRNVGRRLRFGDGTSATVYRETVVARPAPVAPSVLVVGFRLRAVRRDWGHSLFRLESALNTVLFVGFEGFVSKLWLRHDEQGLYRGVYDWDGPAEAEAYVRALWWVLALVSEPRSIHYAVVPGVRRDEALARPDGIEAAAATGPSEWWRPVGRSGATP